MFGIGTLKRQFVAIDFETANPQRVSACALGYAVVRDGEIVESDGFLMKPIGGHAPFQTGIHGISEADTACEPHFGDLYSTVAHLFDMPIVGHSRFDEQVLKSLSWHFSLGIRFQFTDSYALAQQRLPKLENHKLKTLASHFELPFKHHDPVEDARVCAEIFLRLQRRLMQRSSDASRELESLETTSLKGGEVDYKEACQLMYWLEDNHDGSVEMDSLHSLIESTLEDGVLDELEGEAIHAMLKLVLQSRQK